MHFITERRTDRQTVDCVMSIADHRPRPTACSTVG